MEDTRESVALLDEDPGLGIRLSDTDRLAARAALRTEAVTLPRGAWDLAEVGGDDVLVDLVLDGWLMRRTTVGGRPCAVLIGPGAVIRSGDDYGFRGSVPFDVAWEVIEPARLAILGAPFTVSIARWPELFYTLMRRAFERQYLTALLGSIRSLQHVDLRLRAVLWVYATRYGIPLDGGTVLPVRLGHQQLADLVGSQRPSVSAHLAALARRGEILRRADRTWLLRGSPPTELSDLRAGAARPARGRVS